MSRCLLPNASSKRLLGSAMAIGMVLGILYVASPVTVIALAVIAASCWYAGRGLDTQERQWVTVVLALAIAIRLAAIAALFLGTSHDHMVSFPWDGDGVFLKRRGLLIASRWAGVPVDPLSSYAAFNHYYGWTSFQYVLGYLQLLVGNAP